MEVWQILVLLGACVIVYAALLPKQKNSNQHMELIKQMEDTMEHYTHEIEEDNQKLIGHISTLQKDYEMNISRLLGRIESLEHHNDQLQHTIGKLSSDQQKVTATIAPIIAQKDQAVNSDAPAVLLVKDEEVTNNSDDSTANESSIKFRYKELFEWHHQGKSIEYIAKKLNMNKGEVQLILQLASKEEQQGV